MPNYCVCVVHGHLTKDPESRTSQKGTVWMTGTVAYNTKVGDDEKKPHYIDFRAFGYTAKDLEGAKRGDAVAFIGRIEMDTWEKDGQKRSKLSLVVERGNILTKPAPEREAAPPKKKAADDPDIPF